MIRKAQKDDTERIAEIYDAIIESDNNADSGDSHVGWQKGVYPTAKTAEDALERDDMFVMVERGRIVASAIINRVQIDSYRECNWKYAADDSEVMVLHTLCVDPTESGNGYGKRFVAFYENYAAENGCTCLRMDTNERNTNARRMYKKLGYDEAGIVPCDFNGIKGIGLVCLEKKIK